jgi:hypothetical protein
MSIHLDDSSGVLTCDAIRSAAAGISALFPDDPERVAAYRHAQSCIDCARALQEGEKTMQWLDEAAQWPALDATSLAALKTRIDRALERDDAAAKRWHLFTPVLNLAQAALLLVIYPHHDFGELMHAAALSLIASLALWVAIANRRRTTTLFAGLTLGAAAIGSALTHDAHGPLSAATGLHCMGFEFAVAILPWIGAAYLLRAGHLRDAKRTLAWHGLSASMVGQAALLLACKGPSSLAHVAIFHLGGALIAAAIGWTAGSWLDRRLQPSAARGR